MPLEVKFTVEKTLSTVSPNLIRHQKREEAELSLRHLQSTTDPADGFDDVLNFPIALIPQANPSTDAPSSYHAESKVKLEDTSEADAEAFVKEFQKMLSESLEGRKNEKRLALDVAIPMQLKHTTHLVSQNEDHESTMNFKVLTKIKGKGGNVRSIDVPADSQFAQNTLIKQEVVREEQQHLKKMVLRFEQQASVDERR